MEFNILGKNIEVTDGIREHVEDKLGKLEKYFAPDTRVNVTLSVEKDRQKIEVTIPVKGNIIRSEQVSNDMYVSIDLVEEIIERQLKKYKNKLIDLIKNGENGYLSKDYTKEEYLKALENFALHHQQIDKDDLKESFHNHFSIESCASQYYTLYTNTLKTC